jgi:hypothetical protein
VQVFDFNDLLRGMVLLLKLIRILLMPVFLTRNRLKGWSLPAFSLSEGIAPHPRFTEGESGQKDCQSFCGVEKNQINLLLTFMNTVDLGFKFSNLSFSQKLAHQVGCKN